MNTPRVLLGFGAILLIAGAGLHAAAFSSASERLGRSGLSPVLVSEVRTLWLADSSTLAVVGLGLALLALRRAVFDWPLALILCAVPAATAGLLYFFMGTFFAAHLLLVAALAGVAGIEMARRNQEVSKITASRT